MKKRIISLIIVFSVVFSLYGKSFWGTTAKTAKNDLLKEGFTDIHTFPYRQTKILRPELFVDKYTFIETIWKETTGNAICFTNVLTGKRDIILKGNWLDYGSISVYSLKNNEMYFSTKDGKEFNLYKYNLINKNLELVRHITLENDNDIKSYYLDEECRCIYIELGNKRDIYCYDLYSDSQYTKKQHLEYLPYTLYPEGLYPFVIFNPVKGENELYSISKYKNDLYPEDYVRINEDEYLVVNRCRRLISELFIVNIKTNSSRLFRLKDFGYEITGLYRIGNDEYCFIVKCRDSSRVFCYFTKDMFESQ